MLLAVLAVAAIVALLIWQPWRSAADEAAKPAASTTPAATATPTASPTPTTSALETPAPTPTSSETATAIAPCTTSDISVLAVTDKDSYGSGELPKLSITISNDGDEPCLMNVGTTTQKFEITSGSDVWWRSTDCQTESSDQVVQIAAGQTVSSATPLEWSRTRSSVDTCDAKDRPKAGAGSYHLSVSIGGIEAADTRYFQLR